MGKIMTMLEKYNLVEKELEELAPDDSQPNDETINFSSSTTSSLENETFKITPEEEAAMLHYETSEQPPQEIATDVTYAKAFSLNEVYELHHLKEQNITSTVFVLENLIKALPEELPEYIKQSTINNIIVASAMDLPKLITDGTMRHTALKIFLEDYTHSAQHDMQLLKEEIGKLNQIISGYQKQIKQREQLLTEQTNLIKIEEERIEKILNFFEE